MSALTVRELNSNISKALARVEAGETIDILRNGKVVAEIRPKDDKSTAEWRKAYRESVELLRRGLAGRVERITDEDKYGDAYL